MAELAPIAGNLLEFVEQGDSRREQDGSPREQCGVYGVWERNSTSVVDYAFTGAKNLQHRGEDNAGIFVVADSLLDGQLIRGSGKVIEVFGKDGAELSKFPSDVHGAIAQVRYATDKSAESGNDDGAQPRKKSLLSLGHNGQITNTEYIAQRFGITEYTTDSDLIAEALDKLAREKYSGNVKEALPHLLNELDGSFCLVILTNNELFAVRDRHGIRPMEVGNIATGGKIVSSENRAITQNKGATWEREVQPGEMVVISDSGVENIKWAEPDLKICLLEYLYLSNKETILNGRNVGEVRRELGRILWEEHSAKFEERFDEDSADAAIQVAFNALMGQLKGASFDDEPETIVVPVPNGGIQAAHGFAEASGLPFVKDAFIKKDEAGRSFLQKNDAARISLAASKLILDAGLVKGKRLKVIDDTVVRGHTAKVNMGKLKDANPDRIDLLVAAPPFVNTCGLGVDIGELDELLYVQKSGDFEEMRKELGVDSLTFLSLQAIANVLGNTVCMKCIGGSGPSPILRQATEFPALAQNRTKLPLFVA